MKAAVVKSPDALEIKEIPIPEPGRGEVLIKVAYCGICGSDFHMLDVGLFPPGCTIGHEFSGRVERVGGGVVAWKEGDAVTALPGNPCFECGPCRSGHAQLCADGMNRSYGLGKKQGGFAQYVVVAESSLFKIPDGLDLKTAAITEPFAVAIHAVNLLDFKIGGSVCVIGAGPIGLLTISALKLAGAFPIVVLEIDAHRMERAKVAGADAVINPKTENAYFSILQKYGSPVEYSIDCAGTADTTQLAASLLGARGKVAVLGVYMGQAAIIPVACITKEIQINFSYAYNLKEFQAALNLLAKGVVEPETIISGVMPLGEIDRAFKLLHESGHSKILIDCQSI